MAKAHFTGALSSSARSPQAATPPEPVRRRNQRTPRAVVIKDPLIPHTHMAQEMEPYSGPLPSFVSKMDEVALRAGLTVRHLIRRRRVYACELLISYSGSRKRVSACGLLAHPERILWPKTRKPARNEAVCCEPSQKPTYGNIYHLPDRVFALVFHIDLPRISTPASGVECCDYRLPGWGDGQPVAYCGTAAALVKAGITDSEMLPADGTERKIYFKTPHGYEVTLEESVRMHDGAWAYLKYPERAKSYEEAQQHGGTTTSPGDSTATQEAPEERLRSYSTPDEYLKAFADMVFYRAMTTRNYFKDVQTKAGWRYRFTPEAMERARDLISDLYHDLRELTVNASRIDVRTADERRVAAQRAINADTDADFKRFMRELVPSAPRDARN